MLSGWIAAEAKRSHASSGGVLDRPLHASFATERPFAAARYDNVTIVQVLRMSNGGPPKRVLFCSAKRAYRIDEAGAQISCFGRNLTFCGAARAPIPGCSRRVMWWLCRRRISQGQSGASFAGRHWPMHLPTYRA